MIVSFAFQNRPRPLWRVCGDTVWVSKAGEVPSATLLSWWVTAASHVPLTENVKQYRIKTVVFSGQNVLVQILRICCEYIRASLSPVDIRAGRMLLSSLPSHLPGTGNEWRHAGYLNLAHSAFLVLLICIALQTPQVAGQVWDTLDASPVFKALLLSIKDLEWRAWCLCWLDESLINSAL